MKTIITAKVTTDRAPSTAGMKKIGAIKHGTGFC
jgi:hypothetical protein